MNNHEDHQVIPDSTLTELCESLINTLGTKPQNPGFMRSEYMILVRSTPAVDAATAEAYAEATISGQPIPEHRTEAHRGYGLTQVTATALAVLKDQALSKGGRPLSISLMLEALAKLGTGEHPAFLPAQYSTTTAIIHVYHRDAPGCSLLVTEIIRKGGSADPRAHACNRYSIRQYFPMKDTATLDSSNSGTEYIHMIIPEDWYPLEQGATSYQWGHHEIPRSLPSSQAWGQPLTKAGKKT